MKIICTEYERVQVKKALRDICPFGFDCPKTEADEFADCADCQEANIEWEVTDDE